ASVRLAKSIYVREANAFALEALASVRALLPGITEITGTGWSEEDLEGILPLTGGARQFVAGTLRDSTNLTMPESGYKVNVIPQTAEASFDCRFLPGHQEQVLA